MLRTICAAACVLAAASLGIGSGFLAREALAGGATLSAALGLWSLGLFLACGAMCGAAACLETRPARRPARRSIRRTR